MHPSSIFSYYPTYSILDEALSSVPDCNCLNIYLDVKNIMQTIYLQHSVINLIESTQRARYIDTSIFTSLISYLSFHKIYSIKRNININFYLFMESGKSAYHLNIDKRYKRNRHTDELYGLSREKRELFFEILQKNLQLMEKACNKMPNVSVIRLENFEADFIPYYLISRNITEPAENELNIGTQSIHIVYSNDHDLLQTLTAGKNVFIFQKIRQTKKLYKRGEGMTRLLKKSVDFPDTLIPMSIAVIGDVGDDVVGMRGIGEGRIIPILNDLVTMCGGMDSLYDNISKNNPIFSSSSEQIENKYISQIVESEKLNKTISNNLKLVSFEMISRYFEDPDEMETLKKRDKLDKLLKNKNVVELEKMRDALIRSRVDIDSDTLDNLYYKPPDSGGIL